LVQGIGTTTEVQRYSYQISDLSPGRHLFRLKQIDFDGTTAFHGPIEAVIEVPGSHVLSESYPNPFHASTRFTLTLAREQVVRITLWDATGRLVKALHEGVLPSQQLQVFQIDGTDLASGVYHYRIEGESFMESRSVMLLR
jgi:hypothetical protein